MGQTQADGPARRTAGRAAGRPAGRAAEREAAWLVRHRDEVVGAVLRAVSGPGQGGSPLAAGLRAGELEAHVRHLLASLAAALVAEDDAILRETRDWLAQVLATRGADPDLLRELWSALGPPLRGRSRARIYLTRVGPGYPGCPEVDVTA